MKNIILEFVQLLKDERAVLSFFDKFMGFSSSTSNIIRITGCLFQLWNQITPCKSRNLKLLSLKLLCFWTLYFGGKFNFQTLKILIYKINGCVYFNCGTKLIHAKLALVENCIFEIVMLLNSFFGGKFNFHTLNWHHAKIKTKVSSCWNFYL